MRKAVVLTLLVVSMTMTPLVSALDGDGDGISDSTDVCPYAYGTANSTLGNGCPDSDGDGLADFEQSVINDWSDSASSWVDKNSMDPNVHAIAWALNDSYFYAGSDNNEVRIYDSKGYDKGLIKSMPGSVYDIEVSPDGTKILVASGNGGCQYSTQQLAL